jgi:hypothetical protein
MRARHIPLAVVLAETTMVASAAAQGATRFKVSTIGIVYSLALLF